MNYMVIGPCTITFLLIANILLVFLGKRMTKKAKNSRFELLF